MDARTNILAVVKTATILIIVGMTTSNLSAQPPGFQGARHGAQRLPFHHLERLADELGLSEEQRNAIRTERFNRRKEAIELRSKIQLAELELREMMRADNPDQAKISQKVELIGEMRTSMRKARVQSLLNLKEILTEEQRKQLRELRHERRDDRREDRPLRRGFRWRRFGAAQPPGEASGQASDMLR